jgi:hypothetical protein
MVRALIDHRPDHEVVQVVPVSPKVSSPRYNEPDRIAPLVG